MSDFVEVMNVNHPGRATRVNREKYEAVRDVLLAALPVEAPGLTVAELSARVKPALPEALFPGGATAGWWIKCVQLDLEARGTIRRAEKPPVRLVRV